MILNKLNLVNFRAFEQIEMAFKPGVNVIAGVNGVGKSSLLRAMATALSHVVPLVTPSSVASLSLTDEDVTLGKSSAAVTLSVGFDGHEISATLQRLLESRPERARLSRELEAMKGEKRRVAEPTKHLQRLEQLKLKRRLQGLRGALAESGDNFTYQIKGLRLSEDAQTDAKAVKHAADAFIAELRERPNQPVAVFYSPRRSLATRPRTLPAITPLTIPSAYPRALEDVDVELRDFMQWFRYHESTGKRRARPILAQLSEVVTRFVPEFGKLSIEEDPALRFVVEKHGKPFGLHQLSDGERGLLAMIFDITRRLAIANPEQSDPISQGKAVVLIDEIELHLHPNWQRTIVERLNATFRNCQFIATTHSPQIVASVQPEKVSLLTAHGVAGPDRSFGLDSNWILRHLMDDQERPARSVKAIRGVETLIRKGSFPKARQLIASHRKQKLDLPEWAVLETRMARVEVLAK
jgi:predicted ATP-binding protein involved in virulence